MSFNLFLLIVSKKKKTSHYYTIKKGKGVEGNKLDVIA